MPKLVAWNKDTAALKEPELREMFKDYGFYADQWIQSKTGDTSLVIWDFTPKELDTVVKWCVKRGQTNAAVAAALDAAIDGRTDINFAVLMIGKGAQTGFELQKARSRSRR